jgi:hypothetical protein
MRIVNNKAILFGIIIVILFLLRTQTSFADTILYEGFETEQILTWWQNQYEKENGIFRYWSTTEQAHEGYKALQIDYRKDKTYQFIGAKIIEGTPWRDLSKHDTIAIWVYGVTSILLKLVDGNQKECEIGTQQATNPNGWTMLTYNYSSLRNQNINLQDIQNLLFFIAPNDPKAQGTIYLDDIQITSLNSTPMPTPTVNKTPTLTLSSTPTIIPVTPSLINTPNVNNHQTTVLTLENFETKPDSPFRWWITGGSLTRERDLKFVHDGSFSLRVDYKKTKPDQFFGFNIDVGTVWRDFSSYNAIIIWVYGTAEILLRLEDKNNKCVDLAKQRSTNSNEWNMLTYNYSNLIDQNINLKDIKKLSFCIAPGNSKATGTIYLDDLQIASQNVASISVNSTILKLEDFETKVGSSLTWEPNVTYNFERCTDFVYNGKYSLKVTYLKTSPYQFFNVGINTNTTLHDISEYNTVVVWVYGTAEILLKLEDSNKSIDIGIQKATNSNDWTRLIFNYSKLSEQLNLRDIKNLSFCIAPGDLSAAGIIYLDNLQIER